MKRNYNSIYVYQATNLMLVSETIICKSWAAVDQSVLK